MGQDGHETHSGPNLACASPSARPLAQRRMQRSLRRFSGSAARACSASSDASAVKLTSPHR